LAANIATGLNQTVLGAIIGALLLLCLVCGAGAFLIYCRRKNTAMRKTLSKPFAANTGSAAIVAIAPPAAQAEHPASPSRIRRRSSGLQYVRVEGVDVVV